MTRVWIDTKSMKFIGYYCPTCQWEFRYHEVLGSMFRPVCPNCKLDVMPLYDIESAAIHAIQEDEDRKELRRQEDKNASRK